MMYIDIKCKYCNSTISFFKFYPHYLDCKRHRKRLIAQKINRNLTVPSDSLIQLIADNLSQLDEILSQNKFYRNVYNLCTYGKLNRDEAIAVSDLFWLAHTPWYGDDFVPGWLYLGRLCKDDNGVYAICSDWRSEPPDPMVLPIDMIPAEILAEALNLIGVTVDSQTFISNKPYQPYIEERYKGS